MISVLTEIMECNYHWTNNKECKSDFYDLVPETFKNYYKETLDWRFKVNFSAKFNLLPSEWLYKYTSIINESLFDFIKSNNYADFCNIEYLVKMIENILKIAKFKIDEF